MRTTQVFGRRKTVARCQALAHGRYALLLAMCQTFTNVANAPISGMIASLYALQKIIFKNERAWRN